MASASWRSIALRLSPLLREFGIELPAVADIRQCVGHAEIFQALIEPLQFLRAFLHTLLQFTLGALQGLYQLCLGLQQLRLGAHFFLTHDVDAVGQGKGQQEHLQR